MTIWQKTDFGGKFIIVVKVATLRCFLFSGAAFLSATSNLHAFTLSSTVEAITLSNVGAGFQTVNFENTYTNAVPVCSYTLASAVNPPATVRITGVGSTSMQVRIQQFENSDVVTPGTVSCLIAEEGVSILPDGRRLEARTVLSTSSHGTSTGIGFTPTGMENISTSFSGFSSAIALGQVMTFNDARASVFHANDCENRGNPPFQSGFSDGICVTKHIGQLSGTRSNETLGVVVIERGAGNYEGIAYDAQLGPDNVLGVGNSPPYNYGLSGSFEFAVVTMGGEAGGNGGWAVTYGSSPVNGSTMALAIEEEVAAGDTTRRHTAEPVAYFVVRRRPVLTAAKTVDRVSIAETLTLNYNISLENTGQLDQTGVVVTDTLPDGSNGTVTGPAESLTSDGIFEVGETFTYTISYPVTAADITAGLDLVNNISVTSDQYTSEGQADETATASTVILPPNPSIAVTKTADVAVDIAVGQLITYTYVVTNDGNQTISNVSLSDLHGGSGAPPTPRNEGLTADNGIAGDSSDGLANDGTWDVLAPGDEVTFTGQYIVTQSDIDTLQ